MADLSRNLVLELLINARNNTGGATREASANIETIATTAQKVSALVQGYLTYRIAVSGAEEFIRLNDLATNLAGRLKIATTSQTEFNKAQDGLFDVAQHTRSSLESVISLYAQTNKTVRELGKSQEDSLALNQLINESYKISGASTAAMSGSLEQFIQSLQSGVFRGQEFNSVMEQGPRLAQALADGLGVPKDSLRGLAEEGKLTSKTIIDALLSQRDVIEAEYSKIEQTVEGSMTQARNALLRYVSQSEQAHSITQKLAGGISTLAEHVDDLVSVGEVLGTVLLGKIVVGMTGATRSIIENTLASREKAAADLLAANALRDMLSTQSAAVAISAKLSAAVVAEARARKEQVAADAASRTASLESARAALQVAEAVEIETAALQAATLAARERLVSAATTQSIIAAEAELSAAIEAEAKHQWTAAAAAKAHSDALGKLMASEAEAALATGELTAAEKALNTALANNRAASAESAAASAKITGAVATAGTTAKVSTLAFDALNAAMMLPLAWEVGQTIGEWATQFEKVRIGGSYLAEMWVNMGIEWRQLKGDLTWEQYYQELGRVQEEFKAVRDGLTDASEKMAQAQQAATEQVKQQQAARRESFDKTAEKLKEGTKIVEEQYARQAGIQDQALAAKLAKIAASGQAENLQAQQSAVAENEAMNQRLLLIEQYGQRRLSAITLALGTEAEIEKQSAIVRQAAEQASLEARKATYQSLATAYAAVVDSLQQQWQREMQAFQQGTQGLKGLAITHEQEILAIRRSAMTDREKLRSQELERDAAIAKLKAEQAKGLHADEKELNRLYSDASKLIGQVNDANVSRYKTGFEKSSESRKSESLLSGLWEDQKAVLERITAQHKTNADVLLPSLDKAKGKLDDVNRALGELDQQLANSKSLKIELDQASVQQAMSTIREITAPATKLVTIVTQTQGAATDVAPVQKRAMGGEVFKPIQSGQIPGWSHEDDVPLLAKGGEFVVNQEATANNKGLLEKINKYGRIYKFATGGLVPDAFTAAFTSRLDNKLTALTNIGYSASSSQSTPSDWQKMEQIIRDIRTAIDRAPQSLRPRLNDVAASKLSDLLTQASMSRDYAVDNAADPLSVVQNTPGLLGKLEDKIRFFQNAIQGFGGQSLGGAYLGGFNPFHQGRGMDMQYASPNFAVPNINDLTGSSRSNSSVTGYSMSMGGAPLRTVRHVIAVGSREFSADVTEASSSQFEAGIAALAQAKERRG